MEIESFLSSISKEKIEKLKALPQLYSKWNAKINVISRKDMDHIWEHHILHSISIAGYFDFKPTSKCLDLGTGGGLPGIPLSILFPEVNFTLIDGTAKKIHVAQEIANELDLVNCEAIHERAENLEGSYDFILARAVTRLNKLYNYCIPLISKVHKNPKPNGLITLKGGDLSEECKEIRKYYEIYEINQILTQEYFKNKYIVYVPIIM